MKTPVVKITAVASIESGFSPTGVIADEIDGTHQVVMAKHLTAGEPYQYQEEHRLRVTPLRAIDRYLVHPGDILMTSRGAWNYPVVIETIPRPAIAPASLYIIRPVDSMDPNYLVWAMQQEQFQCQLNEIRVGSGRPMILRTGLEELSIPLPCLATQKKIVALAALMRRERQIRKELSDETERLQSAIGRQITNSLIGGRGNES